MIWKLSLACLLALTSGAVAGCATSSPDYYPSASPGSPSASPVRTDAPQIDNADAAGPASVPGTHTGYGSTVVAPSPGAPVVVRPAPPAPVIVVPPQPR